MTDWVAPRAYRMNHVEIKANLAKLGFNINREISPLDRTTHKTDVTPGAYRTPEPDTIDEICTTPRTYVTPRTPTTPETVIILEITKIDLPLIDTEFSPTQLLSDVFNAYCQIKDNQYSQSSYIDNATKIRIKEGAIINFLKFTRHYLSICNEVHKRLIPLISWSKHVRSLTLIDLMILARSVVLDAPSFSFNSATRDLIQTLGLWAVGKPKEIAEDVIPFEPYDIIKSFLPEGIEPNDTDINLLLRTSVTIKSNEPIISSRGVQFYWHTFNLGEMYLLQKYKLFLSPCHDHPIMHFHSSSDLYATFTRPTKKLLDRGTLSFELTPPAPTSQLDLYFSLPDILSPGFKALLDNLSLTHSPVHNNRPEVRDLFTQIISLYPSIPTRHTSLIEKLNTRRLPFEGIVSLEAMGVIIPLLHKAGLDVATKPLSLTVSLREESTTEKTAMLMTYLYAAVNHNCLHPDGSHAKPDLLPTTRQKLLTPDSSLARLKLLQHYDDGKILYENTMVSLYMYLLTKNKKFELTAKLCHILIQGDRRGPLQISASTLSRIFVLECYKTTRGAQDRLGLKSLLEAQIEKPAKPMLKRGATVMLDADTEPKEARTAVSAEV